MNFPKPQIDRETAMQLWIEEHSDYAKEQVVLNNIGMVGSVLKSLNLNLFDEDLFETGLVGLVKAVNTFRKEKGVRFSTYAIPIIRNEVLHTIRKKQIISSFSFDDFLKLDNGDEVPYSDMIADSKQFEEDVIKHMLYEQIMNMVSDKEREIISLYIDRKSQREIGEIFGISQAYTSWIIRNAYKKCKKILNVEG